MALEYSGLAKDTSIVKEVALRANWRARTTWRKPMPVYQRVLQRLGLHNLQPRRFDLNIFLQQPEEWWLLQARKSIVIPNADWFTSYGIKLVPRIHQIWCKTREAVGLFGAVGADSVYMGFTSEDPSLLVDAWPDRNWREALHVAGSSHLKGSAHVINAWARNPHWPLLNLVTSIDALRSRAAAVPNIRVWRAKLSAFDLAMLQLRCGIHVQPSETEGYGHVLGEALAAGAVVVTVDAAPMNELVQDARGYLVAARATTMHCLARRYEVIDESLDGVLNAIWDMPVEQLALKGNAARVWHAENKEAFHQRLMALLASMQRD